MWNNIFVLFILNVLIHHTRSNCPDPCYETFATESLRVTVQINTNCPPSFTNNTYSYYKGDNITLTCVRKEVIFFYDPGTLVWKFKQYNKEFMVTAESDKQNTTIFVYQIRTTLDRYDHYLYATCEAISKHKNESITVRFNIKQNQRQQDNDFKYINYTEGETVPNKLNSTVFVYSQNNFKESNRIDPGNNIYDHITAKESGSIYTAWFDEQDPDKNNSIKELCSYYKRVLYKKKWKIFVTPSPNSRLEELASNSSIVAVIAGVISLFIIILLTYCVYYKYFKKRETVEEHIYWEPTHVVYAEIDHKNSDAPAPTRTEEHYAQIIGTFKSTKIPITTIGAHQSRVA